MVYQHVDQRMIRVEAERIDGGRAQATRYPSNPSSPPRSGRPRRLVYALVGGGAAFLLVVLVVLATIGAFGSSSGAPVTRPGAAHTASSGVSDVVPEDVVAAVGGTLIVKQQFDQRVADFEAQYASQIPDKSTQPDRYKLFRQDVLEYMITYEVVAQKARQLNIAVTDQDVQTWVDSVVKDAFSGDQARFDASLKQQAMTLDQLKRSYKESTLFRKVYDQVTNEIATVPDGQTLDARRKEVWQKWIEQARVESGVTYADGWKPTGTTGTLVP